VRFCPWYPLAQAADLAPPSENVIQLRLATGLARYPRGQSAMVFYAHSLDARATALQHTAPVELWCRHLIEMGPGEDLRAFYAKLVADFVTRFGEPPALATPR
jgi:hypothetical protein